MGVVMVVVVVVFVAVIPGITGERIGGDRVQIGDGGGVQGRGRGFVGPVIRLALRLYLTRCNK